MERHVLFDTVTTSVGIAHFDGEETIGQWMSRADRALYAAKSAGRDQCAVAT